MSKERRYAVEVSLIKMTSRNNIITFLPLSLNLKVRKECLGSVYAQPLSGTLEFIKRCQVYMTAETFSIPRKINPEPSQARPDKR